MVVSNDELITSGVIIIVKYTPYGNVKTNPSTIAYISSVVFLFFIILYPIIVMSNKIKLNIVMIIAFSQMCCGSTPIYTFLHYNYIIAKYKQKVFIL